MYIQYMYANVTNLPGWVIQYANCIQVSCGRYYLVLLVQALAHKEYEVSTPYVKCSAPLGLAETW